jgi:hypothetical protein
MCVPFDRSEPLPPPPDESAVPTALVPGGGFAELRTLPFD